MNKYFSKFLQMFSRSGKKKPQPSSCSEVERLTTELIQETEAALLESFRRSMADYEDLSQKKTGWPKEPALQRIWEHKILEKSTAYAILTALLQQAIAYRKMLATRIEQDVETGTLFERYYGRMQVINAQTIDAYEKLKLMDRERDAFRKKCSIYNNLAKQIYIDKAIPGDSQANPDGSSTAQATDAKEAARTIRHGIRRWDIQEELNLRKFPRLSPEEAQQIADDYLAWQITEISRSKDAREAEVLRREEAEAALETFLAQTAAEEARAQEALAAENASRAKVLAEVACAEEAQAAESAARAKEALAQAQASQARAEAEATQARVEADAAQTKAETEAAQAQAEAEAAQAKAEAAQTQAEAKAAQAKANQVKAEAVQDNAAATEGIRVDGDELDLDSILGDIAGEAPPPSGNDG